MYDKEHGCVRGESNKSEEEIMRSAAEFLSQKEYKEMNEALSELVERAEIYYDTHWDSPYLKTRGEWLSEAISNARAVLRKN